MGDPVQSKTTKVEPASADVPRADDSAKVIEHRIEGPHLPIVSTHIASIGASLPISTATDQPLARSISEAESDQETQPQPTDDSVREERFDRLDREDQLLNQANQIVEHVRSQFAELSRREQRLNNQLSLLDQEIGRAHV